MCAVSQARFGGVPFIRAERLQGVTQATKGAHIKRIKGDEVNKELQLSCFHTEDTHTHTYARESRFMTGLDTSILHSLYISD